MNDKNTPDGTQTNDTAVSTDNAKNGENKLAKLNPKHWTKRTKLIAVGAVLALVLAGVGGGVAYHQYTIARDCKAQSQLFTTQKSDLDKALQEAQNALSSVQPSEEGSYLQHTNDFPTSTEGQEAINALNKVLNKAEKHSKEDTVPEKCSDSKTVASFKALTDARQADLDALKAQTTAFITARDTARLAKASEEANTAMDTAKTDLAAAQKDATDQLAVVDGDTGLQGDATVKAAYDALKAVEADSHSVSTTVTDSTYDEAVASIDKAKTVAAKTGEITAASQALKDAITAYQNAKAAEAAAAQAQQSASSYSGYSGGYSNYSGGSSSGYSGGGSYSDSGSSSGGGGGNSGWTDPLIYSTHNSVGDGGGDVVYYGTQCPNYPGMDFVTYRASKGWTLERAKADCGR